MDGSGELELRELASILHKHKKPPRSKSSASTKETTLKLALDDKFPPEAHGARLLWLVQQYEERQREQEELLTAEVTKRKDKIAAAVEAAAKKELELNESWTIKESEWLSERRQLEVQLKDERREAEQRLAAEQADRKAEAQRLKGDGPESSAAKAATAKKTEEDREAMADLRGQLERKQTEVCRRDLVDQEPPLPCQLCCKSVARHVLVESVQLSPTRSLPTQASLLATSQRVCELGSRVCHL